MKTLKGLMPRCAWCGLPWQQCWDPTFTQEDSKRSMSASRPYHDPPDTTPWSYNQLQQGHADWDSVHGSGQGQGHGRTPRKRSRRQKGKGHGHHPSYAATAQQAPLPAPPPAHIKGDGKGQGNLKGQFGSNVLAPPPPPPLVAATHQSFAATHTFPQMTSPDSAWIQSGRCNSLSTHSGAPFRGRSAFEVLVERAQESPRGFSPACSSGRDEEEHGKRGRNSGQRVTQGSRQSQESSESSRSCQCCSSQTHDRLACVSSTECGYLAGVHIDVPDTGACLAGSTGHRYRVSHERKEELLRAVGVFERSRCTRDIRRGEGTHRDGHQHATRDFQKALRRSCLRRLKFAGTFGESRNGGTEGEKTAQSCRSSRRRWWRPIRACTTIYAAFWRARQNVTDTYVCLGQPPSFASVVQMNWMHSIVDDPSFQAPWTALNRALQLAYEVGTSSALKVETHTFDRPHRGHRKVSFDNEVQLWLDHDESQSNFAFSVPEHALRIWRHKPWALAIDQQAYHFSPLDFHDDPQSSTWLISEACGIEYDSISFMQMNAPQLACRHELPSPAWVSFPGHNVEARNVQAPLRQIPIAHVDGDPLDAEVDIDPSSSSSSSHTSQHVCLFHLQDPPVFGHIDWTDFQTMMHDAAVLLNIDDDALLGLLDIASPLQDLPQGVVPLIAHIVGDLDPGEPRYLGLADLEIHANCHEGHYYTAPVVDRAVYAFPIAADRRAVFQTVDVETYCRLEQHRCLLYHNQRAVVTIGNPRVHFHPGDYVRIIIPPPVTCEWSTQRLLQFYRQLDDADASDSFVSSTGTGYSPSLVPSEELRQQLGIERPAGTMLLQVESVLRPTGASCSAFNFALQPVTPDCGTNDFKSEVANASTEHSRSAKDSANRWSFTEEFLRAVRLMQETVDAIHEHAGEDVDLQGYAPWIQDVHELWTRLAVLGPGGVEMLGRLETWFTDHYSYQRCYNSRIAVLGPDFENWEFQIKRLWRERVLPDTAIEFHLIYPPPDDRAEQTIGQLMIVQRPVAFQRSLLISIYDSAYDQGRAHSMAIVLGDRVDVFSVQTMLQAGEDCPPEIPQNVCTLFFGNRQLQPQERAFARHGHAFRFLIHRRLPPEMRTLLELEDHDLRQQLQIMIGNVPDDPRVDLFLSAPAWFQALSRQFNELACTEREDEGPVAYVATWQVNGHRFPRCQISRTVRLRSDASAWQRTLSDAWRDRLDSRLRLDLFWIDPPPMNSPAQNVIGHVLLVQEPRQDHASVLISGIAHVAHQNDFFHSALHLPGRQTVGNVIDLLPVPSHLRDFRSQIRVGQTPLSPDATHRFESGDNIVIEIEVDVPFRDEPQFSTAASSHSMLQLHAIKTSTQLPTEAEQPDASQDEEKTADVLTLVDKVDAPVWTFVDCSSLECLRSKLVVPMLEQGSFDISHVKCTLSTLDAFVNTPCWTSEIPLGFHFYTDGAFHRSSGSAAAGVVLIVDALQGPRFGGYHAAWCFSTASAPRAEASALLLAAYWACQLAITQGYHHAAFSFFFDNLYAGDAAQGRCASMLNSDITVPLRSLTLWLEQLISSQLSWTHIKGHSNHPWNDLADAVAYSVLGSGYTTIDVESVVSMCTADGSDHDSSQWLWLYERSLRGDSQAPVLHGQQWRFNIAAPATASPDAHIQPFELRKTSTDAGVVHVDNICLRVATANVLTLFPQSTQAASFLGARAELLAQQFQSEKLQCIGLQETRCSLSGHVMLGCYHVLSASATAKGHGGVQFWVSKTLKVHGSTLDISHEHLRILYADDRRLLVRLRHPQLSLFFVILHAPCNDDEREIAQWWNHTSALIPAGYKSWTWVVLCDANGRIGSIPSRAVGSFGAEDENMRGAVFHDWMAHHCLFAPQTFSSTHQGPHVTWTHAEGKQARLDFIGISDNVPADCVNSWVSQTVDLSILRPDHSCVCAEVWFSLSKSLIGAPSHPAVETKEGDPTWHCDVHTHAAKLQRRLKIDLQPSTSRRPRKPHLSGETLELITNKKRAFKAVRVAAFDARLHRLHLCFQAWQTSLQDVQPACSSTFTCDLRLAILQEDYRLASLRVSTAVRNDDRHFFEELAEHTGQVAEKGFHRIWDAIKPLLPRARNKRKSNLRCSGPTVQQQADHFCRLEAGQSTEFSTLVAECHAFQAARLDEQPLSMHLSQLPSRIIVEDKLQQLTMHKAPGIDGIAPDWLRLAGPNIAEPILQLFMKMWLTGCEPVQFKGGLLYCIAKKVGSREVENMRGIMVIDVLGKLAHSMLRQRFLPALMKWRLPMQLGGFPKCTTLFATHYLKAFNAKAREKKLSTAVLFIDVKSAFHCMVRQIIFGLDTDLPPHLRLTLHDHGCDVEQLLRDILTTSLPFRHDVPLATRRLLQDAHSHTWFALIGSSEAFCTARGSRPGSPLADAAFNALMTKVLETLNTSLDAIQSLRIGFQALGFVAPPVAWVDDVAIPIVASQGDQLEPLIHQVVQVTRESFLKYGLDLNFNAKKTEVVVSFRHQLAPLLRQSLFVERLGQMFIPTLDLRLRCVASYEHLGTVFAADCSLQQEISHRKMKAIQAFRVVGKPILQNRHISVDARLKLFESLIIPVLLHGAGNWDLLPARCFQRLHAQIIGWQRRIINDGCWTENQHSDFELQCMWKLPPLALRLAKARLLYAFHCFAEGPQTLIDFVTSVSHLPHSWTAALRKALAWIADMDGSFCLPALSQAPIEQIVEWFTRMKTVGPKTVKRLFRKAVMQFHVVGDVVTLHKQLKTSLAAGGVVFEEGHRPPALQHDCLFSCDWCPMQFDCQQKMQAHLWTAHQVVSDERRFVFTDTCLACHKCFWTAARLQQHLRLSRRQPDGCYEQLTWRIAPLLDRCLVQMPPDLRGFARLPAQIAPMPQVSLMEHQIATRAEAEQSLLRAWNAEGFPAVLSEHVRNEVFCQADAIMNRWQPTTCCNVDELLFQLTSIACDAEREWALFLWCRCELRFRRFAHLAPAIFQRAKSEVQDVVFDSPIGRLLAWHFRITLAFQPVEQDGQEAAATSLHELEPLVRPVPFQRLCLQHVLHPFMAVPDCSRVPVSWCNGKPTLWILHLFSGRRRRGDCHFWSECCEGVLPGYDVRILSVDTAIHPALGNLERGAVFTRMLRIIRKRFFAAGLTGPPCETFSAARHLTLEGDQCQPRPLRSCDLPWLLEDRSMREMFQTMVGSRLLLHSFIAEASLVLAGAGSMMEHPTEHPDATKVSTWRLDSHGEWMMRLPDAFQHRIEQWRFGSVGVKPTTLRAINLGPENVVRKALDDNIDPLAIRPSHVLSGRTEAGAFKTAAAKEYPSRLCRTLIIAVLTGIRHRLDQHGNYTAAALDQSEQNWVQNLFDHACQADLSGTFLPDFQG